MDAVTYPNATVAEFIEGNVVPLRLAFNAEPESIVFKLRWTPTLITLDAKREEHHRTVGFLPPEELIPSLLLGIAKAHFDRDQFSEALSRLDKIPADYPKSAATPEAVYLAGVARYKSTHDPKFLKEAYERLQAEYPSSEWTTRAYPYRLL